MPLLQLHSQRPRESASVDWLGGEAQASEQRAAGAARTISAGCRLIASWWCVRPPTPLVPAGRRMDKSLDASTSLAPHDLDEMLGGFVGSGPRDEVTSCVLFISVSQSFFASATRLPIFTPSFGAFGGPKPYVRAISLPAWTLSDHLILFRSVHRKDTRCRSRVSRHTHARASTCEKA